MAISSRERVQAALSFDEADRIPISDSVWPATVTRWRQEGLPSSLTPAQYFGYEIVGFSADTSPRFPIRILDEDAESVTQTTPFGQVRRDLKTYASTPEIVDYPCKSVHDWQDVKQRLAPAQDRVDWLGEWVGKWPGEKRVDSVFAGSKGLRWRGLPGNRQARSAGMFITYNAAVGYDKAQYYVRSDQLLMAMVTDPDWIRDIYATDADLVIETCEAMLQGGFEFDGAFLTCDLAYRNGLLFSPRLYELLLRPVLRRLLAYFNDRHMPVILHTDGRVHDLIPYFVQDGLACLQPLEVKAGMDLVDLKGTWHKKLSFMGGIDVQAMAAADPALIEKEIRRKVPVAKRGGGYIYHSDHSVPDNVSLAQYERTLALVRAYGQF